MCYGMIERLNDIGYRVHNNINQNEWFESFLTKFWFGCPKNRQENGMIAFFSVSFLIMFMKSIMYLKVQSDEN